MADIKSKLIVDTRDAKKSVDGLKSAFKGLLAAASVQQFVSLGDEFTQITNRLKSVSDSTEEASSAFNLVKKVAAETRSGLGPVADLFTDLTIATEEMGLSQERVAGVAATFSKALKISGADANASAGAIRQFGQALASGVLRGDEFISIMEANPAFMRKVAEALDVTTGELRKMAGEGQLTSDVLVKATEEIGDAIDEDFGKTVSTVGESIVNLKNNFIEFIGAIQEKTGVFTIMSQAINLVADNLNIMVALFAAAFGAAVVGQIITVTKTVMALGKSFMSAAKGATIMQAVIAGPAGIAKVIGGLVAGGGALYLLDGLMEDTAESSEQISKELDEAAKNSKDLEGSAKAALETSKKQTQAEKDAKTARDEATRILENQLEEFKAITGELELGRDELQAQLDLQNDLLAAGDSQKQTISAIADLEKQRADDLRDLNALTKINAEERLAKEKEINQEYDARILLIKDQEKALLAASSKNLIARLYEDLVDGAITMSDTLETMRQLNKGQTEDEIRNYDERLQAQKEYQKNVRSINEQFFGADAMDPEARIRKLSMMSQAQKDAYNTDIENAKVYYDNFLGLLTQFQIERTNIENTPTKFADGFKNAFIEFEKNLKDNAASGRKIFTTLTQGWENAILNFVETGKLSFKDLFKTMLAEAVKLFANKAFMTLFSPTGMFGDLFAGFFDKGGSIPFGKVGIAGENGPEFVRGPATVTSTAETAAMMGGRTYVTYNINAVDAPSFQQLVARDPEFIYNVSRAGARRAPA